MKKSLLMLFAGFCLLVSCNSKNSGGGMSDAAKKNLEADHAITTMFESGDFSKLGDYIDSNGVDHASMKGDVKGLESIRAEMQEMGKMTSNMKSEVVKELADDDYVMSWKKESGKMNADGMGMKAGDSYSWDIIEVSKFKGGKATEHWSFMSVNDVMKMMPQQPVPVDTSKNSEGLRRR
jgi:predicted SnoaL-like aldol condensation-catalyzing enzyme